ncbi:MAG: GAF domain-containing protein [Bacteroidales bacterium]|jgi:GAF domain-containing protein|nr:GAF domain-containing protein [Bacteroidales bacterium]
MESTKKQGRYSRICDQLRALLKKSPDADARMATIAAVLHHKLDYFFWTGFYMLREGELVVRCYQGPVACQVLEKGRGVCWAAIERGETIVVEDVHLFPGHIACDSRSNSEIVVPVRDARGVITGVLDIDSRDKGAFDQEDAEGLEKIIALLALSPEML